MAKSLDRFLEPVKSVDELPAPFADAVRNCLPVQTINSIILIPPQEYPIQRLSWLGDLPFGWRRTPRRALVLAERFILVVGAEPDNLTTTLIPIESIIGVTLGTVLLRAYVRFVWTIGNHVESVKIEFNSVGEYLVRRQLSQLRPLIIQATAFEPLSSKTSDAVIPTDLALKFHNYLNFALLPGERLLTVVYQPRIRRTQVRLKRFLSPRRTLAVTDLHVIVLEEAFEDETSPYSITTCFYPLNHVQRVTLEPDVDAEWLRLFSGTAADSPELAAIPLFADIAEQIRDSICQAAGAPILTPP